MPNPAHTLSKNARQALSTKTIIPVVGISSIGKNAIMDTVIAQNPNFCRASGFTTRTKRPGEANDAYVDWLEPGLNISKLLHQADQNELIQYFEHPTTHDIYGTMLKHYKAKYNMLDALSGSVKTFESLGFKACKPIAVVAAPSDWQARFNQRTLDTAIAQKRITEGVQSLQWALAMKGNVYWIINKTGHLGESAQQLEYLVTSNKHSQDNTEPQKIAKDLLQKLQTML